jgi:hypothetical protein
MKGIARLLLPVTERIIGALSGLPMRSIMGSVHPVHPNLSRSSALKREATAALLPTPRLRQAPGRCAADPELELKGKSGPIGCASKLGRSAGSHPFGYSLNQRVQNKRTVQVQAITACEGRRGGAWNLTGFFAEDVKSQAKRG